MHVKSRPDPGLATEPLACTGARARRLTRRLTSFYEQAMRPTGLKLGQYPLLKNLSDDAQSVGELAARLEMDRTTLTRSLGPLLDNGWAEAVPASDARQRTYVITAAGRRFRQGAEQHWRSAQLALEGRLGRDYVAALNATLEDALARLKPALPEDN